MSSGNTVFGLGVHGNKILEVKLGPLRKTCVAWSRHKDALGTLLEKFYSLDYASVNAEPGDELLNVIIGDERLIRGVKVLARGIIGKLRLRNDIRSAIGPYCEQEIIVFENKKGERIYVYADYTALLLSANQGALMAQEEEKKELTE